VVGDPQDAGLLSYSLHIGPLRFSLALALAATVAGCRSPAGTDPGPGSALCLVSRIARHIAAITGAYIAGILVSRTEMREWVHDGISKIGYSFLIPIFFVYVGIQADFRDVCRYHLS